MICTNATSLIINATILESSKKALVDFCGILINTKMNRKMTYNLSRLVNRDNGTLKPLKTQIFLTSASSFLIMLILLAPFPTLQAQVGIGTNAPKARFHVADSSVLFTGPSPLPGTAAPTPVTGTGTRFFWYADKAAVRGGRIMGNGWNKDSIGQHSTAFGLSSIAKGNASFVTGSGSRATGLGSVAMGLNAEATADFGFAVGNGAEALGTASFAVGNNTSAVGQYAVALGSSSTAANDYAFASGNGSTASSYASTAIGDHCTATGLAALALGNHCSTASQNAVAMGYYSSAGGQFSVSIGNQNATPGQNAWSLGANNISSGNLSMTLGYNVNTNNKSGAFYFGDSDPFAKGQILSAANNQFSARFNGGYYFITDNSGSSDVGVTLPAGGNAWVSICDRNRKENLIPLDGNMVLNKLSNILSASWNYKGQDATKFRHYGIMAQDFYNAFGHDAIGEIGNDTTINPVDLLGVLVSAIQALEVRTREWQEMTNENAVIRQKLLSLEEKLK